MRFGRKLALQVTSDQSGAPYLSHKAMKEAINKTVRDLRLYQSRSQSLENFKAGMILPEGEALPSADELARLEEQIKELDKELFSIVEEDLEKIFVHIRQMEGLIEPGLSQLQEQAMRCGLLMEESLLKNLQDILPVALESPAEICQRLIEIRIMQDPLAMIMGIHELILNYNGFLEQVDEHTQYLEINVAGFRKLLKRHEKQVPHMFHPSKTPCLGFHKLVTKSSRQIVEITNMLGQIISDAIERFDTLLTKLPSSEQTQAAARERQQMLTLNTPKGLGPECQMVLQIQAQLQEPVQTMIPTGTDFLYPKPNAQAPVFKGKQLDVF